MHLRHIVPVALAALAIAALPSIAHGDGSGPPPVVLHVGDSFVASGFAQALKPKFQALGAKYVSNSQTSAYTTTLIRQVKLDSLITVNRPSLVILTIGANEMRMPLPEQHTHAVKNLTKLASATTCIWALPPRWDDKETGILAIMKREAGPCRVHDPSAIEKSIPRGSDKIHPTAKGGQVWADAFWAWLMEGKQDGEVPWGAPADVPQPAKGNGG
jgi:lysophospholipase L1-like esterase